MSSSAARPGDRGVMVAALLACASGACEPKPSSRPQPPPILLGAFVDDYGIQYEISPGEWFEMPGRRYRIIAWDPEHEYLIAQNDSTNAADEGRWTRIDWMNLEGMPPYTWGYCYSVYDAPSPAAAESVRTANRETPRSGCNGYPFSRMRPESDSTRAGG